MENNNLCIQSLVQLPFDEINIRQLRLPTNKNIAYKAYIKNLDASPCTYFSFNEEMFENKAILDDPKYIRDVKANAVLFIEYIYLNGNYDLISQIIKTLEIKNHLIDQKSFNDYMIIGYYPYDVTLPEDNNTRITYTNNLFDEIRSFKFLYLFPKNFSDSQIFSFFNLNVNLMSDGPDIEYEFDIFRFDECNRLYPSATEKRYYYELKQKCGEVAHRKPELVYLYFENQFHEFHHYFMDVSTKVINLFYETDLVMKEIDAFKSNKNNYTEINFENLFYSKLDHLYPFALSFDDEEDHCMSYIEMFYNDFRRCVQYIFYYEIDISELLQLAKEYKKTNEFGVLFKFVKRLCTLGRERLYFEKGKYNGKMMYLVTNRPLRVSFEEYLDDVFAPTIEINVFDTASNSEPLKSGYCSSSSNFYNVAYSLIQNSREGLDFRKEDVEEIPIYITDLSKRLVISDFNDKIFVGDTVIVNNAFIFINNKEAKVVDFDSTNGVYEVEYTLVSLSGRKEFKLRKWLNEFSLIKVPRGTGFFK